MSMCCLSSEASLLFRYDSSGVIRREASQAIGICSNGVSYRFGVEEPRVECKIVYVVASLVPHHQEESVWLVVPM